MITALDDATFDQFVTRNPRPVLVDFWAPWCGPCKMLAPVLEAFAHESGPRLDIVKIDVDANRRVAGRYGLRAVPTLMLFRNGAPIGQKSGAMGKEALSAWVDQALGAPASQAGTSR
ncbi:thioredoxin [Plastorhodobacter daqingensis]|uniref:Thioredoxin n=1 Tax=Plastorhodobacter daqingensis TaxID=1387281 RepID=A0ABW2UIS2_9RHOB